MKINLLVQQLGDEGGKGVAREDCRKIRSLEKELHHYKKICRDLRASSNGDQEIEIARDSNKTYNRSDDHSGISSKSKDENIRGNRGKDEYSRMERSEDEMSVVEQSHIQQFQVLSNIDLSPKTYVYVCIILNGGI